MDRYNHILKRPPISIPSPEMTSLEKFQAIEAWYQSGHFESIIEDLKQYLSPIEEILWGKDIGWNIRSSFFDSEIIFTFTVTFDKGFFKVTYSGMGGPSPLVFEIDTQGKIIGESDKNRAEVISTKLFNFLAPFTFPEPQKEVEIKEEAIDEEDGEEERPRITQNPSMMAMMMRAR